MDTVRAGFIRWFALEKWREVEDLRMTSGMDLARAVEEAGEFPGRGPYRQLWTACWRAEVSSVITASEPGALFAAIEKAVAAALAQEEAQRKAGGDRPLDEDPEYKAFVDAALERLLSEGDLGADR